MKNENKTKILFLILGIIIGVALTMLFQIAILGNANRSLGKNKISATMDQSIVDYFDQVGDCTGPGGVAVVDPNPHYGPDGEPDGPIIYYPNGSITCTIFGVTYTSALH